MEKMEEFLLTASVLQDNAKYLPEDFQVKEGDGSEREEVNASWGWCQHLKQRFSFRNIKVICIPIVKVAHADLRAVGEGRTYPSEWNSRQLSTAGGRPHLACFTLDHRRPDARLPLS